MDLSLKTAEIAKIRAPLKKANAAFVRAYPGETGSRQPVHTFYLGAHEFRSDSAARLGEAALDALRQYAPHPLDLAEYLGMRAPGDFANKVYQRVAHKLQNEPVEDLRADFEDGFGLRPDQEEDSCAASAALEAAKGMAAGTLPPFFGIRIKPFSEEMFARSARTLDLFVTTLLKRSGGRLPRNFAVTLTKVTLPEQVAALARLLERLEAKNRLPKLSLAIEVMIETPQAVIGLDGACAVPRLVAAARGRCVGAHFGTYDYTTYCGVAAERQSMTHPACDFARHMMQVSLAGSGVFLSDGATNVLPMGSAETVRRAWKLAYDHIRHSLAHAYYQGWDLHAAQLPVRYAAVYSFFLEGLPSASRRLQAFVEKAAQATLQGEVFDDAATGQSLLNFFLRGLACGAVTEQEALATGLTMDEFHTRSFLKILEARKRRYIL